MAPKRATSQETAARFLALRGDPNAVLYDILAKERARQSRVHRARQAIKALTPSEFDEFLAEMITRYRDEKPAPARQRRVAMANETDEPRGEYKLALVIESPVTPKQRARNYALYSRLYYGVPPEERTGESREGIGLHVFQFSVPLADCSIGGPGPEVSFRLKPDGECLRRLCSYITDHFDTRCDADDEVERLTAENAALRAELAEVRRG